MTSSFLLCLAASWIMMAKNNVVRGDIVVIHPNSKVFLSSSSAWGVKEKMHPKQFSTTSTRNSLLAVLRGGAAGDSIYDDETEGETIQEYDEEEAETLEEEEAWEEQEEEVLEEALEDVLGFEEEETLEEETMEEEEEFMTEQAETLTEEEGGAVEVDEAEVGQETNIREEQEEEESLAAATATTVTGGGGSEPEDAGETESKAVAATATQSSSEAPTTTAEEGDVISPEMAYVLTNRLGFNRRDLEVLRPDIAAMLVAQNLSKPQEGMPPNWYVAGSKKPSPNLIAVHRKLLVKASVTVAAVGTVALIGLKGDGLDWDEIKEKFGKVPAVLGAIPAALTSVGSSKSPKAPAKKLVAATVAEATPSIPASNKEPSEEAVVDDDDEEVHPHSVKPGATHAPVYEEDLDKTLLDKVITKIENAIKAFFRIKI